MQCRIQVSGSGMEQKNLIYGSALYYMLCTKKGDSQENISKPSSGMHKALHFSQAEGLSAEMRFGYLYDLNP